MAGIVYLLLLSVVSDCCNVDDLWSLNPACSSKAVNNSRFDINQDCTARLIFELVFVRSGHFRFSNIDSSKSLSSCKIEAVIQFLSHQFNPGRIIWKRHMYNISRELQVRVEVLKDMLMYRVDKRQCILTNDEIESIIRLICTE